MFTIAHLSDLHLGSEGTSLPRARRLVDHLCSLDPAPDVLVVTGDIADHGTEDEYAAAREMLGRWPGPILVGTGNHDVREHFARVLLGENGPGPDEPGRDDAPLDQALEVAGVRLLMLDSLVPAVDGVRIDHGLLAPSTLAWLDDQLRSSDLPTFVCLHHPAVSVGITDADQVLLRNADELEPILAAHPHVVATLVGHHHTMCATSFAGRPLLVGGAAASTVTLDEEPLDHLWLHAPLSAAFHLLADDGRLTTHWRALPVV